MICELPFQSHGKTTKIYKQNFSLTESKIEHKRTAIHLEKNISFSGSSKYIN